MKTLVCLLTTSGSSKTFAVTPQARVASTATVISI